MKRSLAYLAGAVLVSGTAWSADTSVDIPYQKFVLDNGLTLLVHEDPKAPIVAVNVWYHVGSKNEKPGRTGFAHLFEHLMFNGSENFDDDYFKAIDTVGATDLNGTTNNDRTNYFQNVPKTALDRALWLESDRMGHLLGAVTQEKLDEQRGVVQNEKREYENEPYAISEELITHSVWPEGHPYSWTVIGSMEDLGAAKLEDVQEWFKSYYGAANAVVAVAGDVNVPEVVAKVKLYFGDIPAGPPVARHQRWIAKRAGKQRQVAQDRVPSSRVYKVWNVPGNGEADATYLDLAASVLASGKTSRLYKRLVYDDQIATSVEAYVDEREIASLFTIEATAKPGGDLAKVEKAVDEELARFLASGPTPDEVERVKASAVAGFVRGVERIGGFGGKSDILASSAVYLGNPDGWKAGFERIKAATAPQIKEAAVRWLSDGEYALEILPYGEFSSAEKGADRSQLPAAGAPPAARFPETERATLGNGLKLLVVGRHSVPVVDFELLVDAGYAADRPEAAGTSSLAMDVLDEGTKRRNALEISEELQRLGAHLSTGSDVDTVTVSMSALTAHLDASLDLFADVVLNPAFPAADFDRLKAQRLARIRQEKAQPVQMALRVFPPLLYGREHAYAAPGTGSGYEATVSKITRDDLVKFHATWFKANNATLIVVGDTSLAQIKPKIEALFAGWAKGSVPAKNLKSVAAPTKRTVYIVDRPGSIQSVILAGQLAPPTANPDEIAFQTLNQALGGSFTARINMNLREDKHWAYGAYSFLSDAKGQRPYLFYAPVQTDKTKEALAELDAEIRGIVGGRPVTSDELQAAKDQQTLTLPGQWETNDAVSASLQKIVTFGLPADYYATFPGKVSALKPADVTAAGKKVLRPEALVWIVVGDRAVIEPRIRELAWGEIQFIDPDGNAVR